MMWGFDMANKTPGLAPGARNRSVVIQISIFKILILPEGIFESMPHNKV